MDYTVTIYHGDAVEEGEPPVYKDELIHTASLLASTKVTAANREEAAAKAWIELIAPPRIETLKRINALPMFIAHQTDLAAIMADIRDTALEGVQCELYNQCEVWYFRIESETEMDDMTGVDSSAH